MAEIDNHRQLCLGDGACCQHAPRTFKLNEDGEVLVETDTDDDRETVVEAASSCRVDAITVDDIPTGGQLVPCK